MDISAALVADLATLTQALDEPNLDLEGGLRAFTADLDRAVPSYLGMTITIALDGRDVSFTVRDDTARRRVAGTSLLIPLAAVTCVDAASTLLLHAATPGAFVDLAADLSYALDIDPALLVLDGNLDPPADSAGVTGLDEQVAINQAVGILIAHGHTPESARQELHRLAADEHGGVRAAAEYLVRRAGRDPTDSA